MIEAQPRTTWPERETTPFSDWLDARLRSARMSQRQLAMRSGVHHSTISRLVRHRRTPSFDTAVRLAKVLDPTGTLPVARPTDPHPRRRRCASNTPCGPTRAWSQRCARPDAWLSPAACASARPSVQGDAARASCIAWPAGDDEAARRAGVVGPEMRCARKTNLSAASAAHHRDVRGSTISGTARAVMERASPGRDPSSMKPDEQMR